MISLRLACAALLLGIAAPALAQGKQAVVAARQAGTVGERFDGYLGYSPAAPAEARRQVGAVNIRRRSLYTGLATRRNVNVQAVGIAAGCELLAQVKVGEVYMLNDGVWRQRAPGQGVPVPSYCAG
ncbi:MAG: YdbL family protein [Sphingomonas sp.]|nr:YdbL family protein [Sphingomonas sp.]